MSRVELEIGERVLGNGLCAIAVRNPGAETFAVAVSLRVGQRDEAPDEHGLAYLVGECLDEGSKKQNALQFAESVEAIGGSIETGSSGGVVFCPADEASKAVKLARELCLEPAFPSRELRRVQQEVLAEIQSDDQDPRTVARRRFRAEVYGDHPYGRPPYGSAERIATYKPVDLRRFHRTHFVPQEGYVAVSGPQEVEVGLDLCAKAFRSFRGKSRPRPPLTGPAMPSARRDQHLSMPREQVHAFLGHPGIRRDDPDFYALLVMDHVLGSGPGFTSRIAKRLRDNEGLCYSVSAGITASAGLERGTFSAYIGTSPKHRKRAIDGFLEEIQKIRTKLVTPSELSDVQDYLTGSHVLGLERNSSLVQYAIRARRFELGYDHVQRFPDLIRAVTREQVRDAAARHLDPDRVVIVSAGAG